MAENEKLREYCLKIKERGKLKYSLINGALFFGVIVCYLSVGLIDLFDTPFKEAYFSLIGLKRLIIGILLGILIYSTIIWNLYMGILNRIDKAKD